MIPRGHLFVSALSNLGRQAEAGALRGSVLKGGLEILRNEKRYEGFEKGIGRHDSRLERNVIQWDSLSHISNKCGKPNENFENMLVDARLSLNNGVAAP